MSNSSNTIEGSLRAFDFLEPIGEGGMGMLWRARHRRQQVDVAVKFIQPSRLESERSRSMFQREAHAMALLNHRAILSIYDYGELTEPLKLTSRVLRVGSPYLVMDYVDGGNLRERRFPRTWRELSTSLEQILDGLAHAHARSLYHRDLKPENIMVQRARKGTQLQLTDFGLSYIANVASESVERDLSAAGTPAYMAPEQINADWRRVGPWTDLYSVGVIAYELACGTQPFTGRTAIEVLTGHLNKPVPGLEPRFAVPDGFEAWVYRLLAKQPERRYQTPVHALNDLLLLEDSDLPVFDEQPEEPFEPQESETLVRPAPTLRLQTIESNTTLVFEPFESDSRATEPLPDFPVFELPERWERAEASPPIVLTGVGLGLFGIRDVGLVDRQEERDAVWENLRRVRDDRNPMLTMVRGPSGRGASAVASWTVRRSAELGAFEVVDMGHGTRYALEFLLGTRDLDGEAREAAIQKSMEQIGRPELTRPAISVIAGARGARPDRVLASYVEARARTRPIAVLIDDAHDELASLTLIRNLLDRSGPIAIVAVVREDDLAMDPVANEIVYHLSRHESSRSVDIGPMTDAGMRAMLRRLIPLDPADLEEVVEVAQGNPRFATELLRDWVKRGSLVPCPHGYEIAPGEVLQIPDSMHEPWAGRVDEFISSYPPDDRQKVRRSLEFGACLGATVSRADWDYAVERAGIELDKFFLNEAAEARLLEGNMIWGRFSHPMLRMSLLRSSREGGRLSLVHDTCERVVAESHPLGDRKAMARRVRHLMGAGRPKHSLELALRFMQGATRDGMFETIRVANAAMDAVDELDLPDNDPRRVELTTRLVLALYHLDHASADRRLAPVLDVEHEQSASLRALVHYVAGSLRAAQDAIDVSLDHLNQALDLYMEVRDGPGEGRTRSRIGLVRRRRREHAAAIAQFERAIDLLEQESPSDAAIAMVSLGMTIEDCEPGHRDALGYLERAIELVPDGHERTRTMVRAEYAEFSRRRGAFQRAVEIYEENASFFGARASAMSLVNQAHLAIARASLGQFETAERVAEAALLDARRHDIPVVTTLLDLILAWCAAELGNEIQFQKHVTSGLRGVDESQFVDADLAKVLESIETAAADRSWSIQRVASAAREQRKQLQS